MYKQFNVDRGNSNIYVMASGVELYVETAKSADDSLFASDIWNGGVSSLVL